MWYRLGEGGLSPKTCRMQFKRHVNSGLGCGGGSSSPGSLSWGTHFRRGRYSKQGQLDPQHPCSREAATVLATLSASLSTSQAWLRVEARLPALVLQTLSLHPQSQIAASSGDHLEDGGSTKPVHESVQRGINAGFVSQADCGHFEVLKRGEAIRLLRWGVA